MVVRNFSNDDDPAHRNRVNLLSQVTGLIGLYTLKTREEKNKKKPSAFPPSFSVFQITYPKL